MPAANESLCSDKALEVAVAMQSLPTVVRRQPRLEFFKLASTTAEVARQNSTILPHMPFGALPRSAGCCHVSLDQVGRDGHGQILIARRWVHQHGSCLGQAGPMLQTLWE